MTTLLRRYANDKCVEQLDIVTDGWDLDDQLKASESWLGTHILDKATDGFWALDIGFNKRPVSIPGYTVSIGLMKLLVANNVTLWLSHYPGDDDESE